MLFAVGPVEISLLIYERSIVCVSGFVSFGLCFRTVTSRHIDVGVPRIEFIR